MTRRLHLGISAESAGTGLKNLKRETGNMPNRIIKESIWTSPNLNELSDLAERHFYRILPLPDDFGCCELTPLVVKGRCYPLKPEVSVEDINKWQDELESKVLIIRWNDGGRQYAIFPSFDKHQRIRSLHQRKTPIPPDDIVNNQKVLDALFESATPTISKPSCRNAGMCPSKATLPHPIIPTFTLQPLL